MQGYDDVSDLVAHLINFQIVIFHPEVHNSKRVMKVATGSISKPMTRALQRRDSTKLVPPPIKGSRMTAPSTEVLPDRFPKRCPPAQGTASTQ